MARLVAVANQKGGIGKTTISVSLAAVLTDAGTSCTVVDVDPQLSAADWLGSIPGRPIDYVVERDADRLRDMSGLSSALVIADTPGSLEGADTLHAVATASDFVIIPAEPSTLSMTPLVRTIKQVVEPVGVPYRVLLSKVRPQAAANAVAAQKMLAEQGIPVFSSYIRLLAAHEHAPTRHQLITTVKGGESGATDLRRVSLELISILAGLN